MELPEPCQYFDCVNPCLRGLALQPLEECIVKYATIIHTPRTTECVKCGATIELTEQDILKTPSQKGVDAIKVLAWFW